MLYEVITGLIIPVLPKLIETVGQMSLAEASRIGGWMFAAFSLAQFVITSYSIHYTKLYDTPEAIYIKDAPGFTLAVQWHPEWNAQNDPVSRPLFHAFGDAVRAWVV